MHIVTRNFRRKRLGVTISILDASHGINDSLRETNGISPTSTGKKVVQRGDAFAEREHCDNGFLC